MFLLKMNCSYQATPDLVFFKLCIICGKFFQCLLNGKLYVEYAYCIPFKLAADILTDLCGNEMIETRSFTF